MENEFERFVKENRLRSYIQDYEYHRQYLQNLEYIIRAWEKPLSCNDRMECFMYIKELIDNIKKNIKGWEVWIRNPEYFALFSLDEMQAIMDSLRNVFLRLAMIDYNTVFRTNQYLLEKINKLKSELGYSDSSQHYI